MRVSLQSLSLLEMTELAAALRNLGAGASSAEEVAQRIAEYLYRHLGPLQSGTSECALARCFLTRPYRALDPESQACARALLGEAPVSFDIPCLALLGTAGDQPEWNAREHSRRYRAIPLCSRDFVAQLPMFSQLFRQLGVELNRAPPTGSNLLVDVAAQDFNVFHVAEALGSPFVPAQEEFVRPFGIQSVLGFGALLAPWEFFVVVLFSKVPISRETAELFKPLAIGAKLALMPFAGQVRGRTIIRVEHQPTRWQSRAEALEQLLLLHEQSVADYAQRKRQAEEALQAKDEQYRALVMQANDILYRTDASGRFTFVNPTAIRIMQYSEDELLGRRFVEFIRPDQRDPAERFYGRQFVRKRRNTYYELASIAKGGREIWVGQHVQLLQEGDRIIGFQAVARDITERKRAEERLRLSKQRLRQRMLEVRLLTGRLSTIQEEERARIARELHDELGVRLSCLKMDLGSLLAMQDRLDPTIRPVAVDKISGMMAAAEETMAAVHQLVIELRPAILDDLGLVAAIEWFCQDFQRRTQIACACVASSDEIAMQPGQATALFRICQEALTNIGRHARATSATVTLFASADQLRLEVADNGIGIPEARFLDRQSLGILGMRERLAQFGGVLSIQGRPGQGTTVTAILPRRGPSMKGV